MGSITQSNLKTLIQASPTKPKLKIKKTQELRTNLQPLYLIKKV